MREPMNLDENTKNILGMVDHTLLKQTATWEEIRTLCDDEIRFRSASVCIPPCYVKQAKEYVKDAMRICTVIGFPNGNVTTATKVFETGDAVKNGADEIDMVINIGMLKAGNDAYVLDEIRQIQKACQGRILKVIIETCLLTEQEKIKMCDLVTESGADYIKTSTGFSTAGAKAKDVALMRKTVGEEMGVKASGGIHTAKEAQEMIDAGASRLGTSATLAIIGA